MGSVILDRKLWVQAQPKLCPVSYCSPITQYITVMARNGRLETVPPSIGQLHRLESEQADDSGHTFCQIKAHLEDSDDYKAVGCWIGRGQRSWEARRPPSDRLGHRSTPPEHRVTGRHPFNQRRPPPRGGGGVAGGHIPVSTSLVHNTTAWWTIPTRSGVSGGVGEWESEGIKTTDWYGGVSIARVHTESRLSQSQYRVTRD